MSPGLIIFAGLSQLDTEDEHGDPVAPWWDKFVFRTAGLIFVGGHVAFARVIRTVVKRNRRSFPPVILRAGAAFPRDSPHTNESVAG